MKLSEIRDRTDLELRTLTRQLSEDLYHLRAQRATNQLENTNTIQLVKKDLARALTVMRARELGHEAAKKETETS
ncbi:MAG: 50S ribosomal protein L29 [Pseudomonadota bacterium]